MFFVEVCFVVEVSWGCWIFYGRRKNPDRRPQASPPKIATQSARNPYGFGWYLEAHSGQPRATLSVCSI
jgi:hypothetical protein